MCARREAPARRPAGDAAAEPATSAGKQGGNGELGMRAGGQPEATNPRRGHQKGIKRQRLGRTFSGVTSAGTRMQTLSIIPDAARQPTAAGRGGGVWRRRAVRRRRSTRTSGMRRA